MPPRLRFRSVLYWLPTGIAASTWFISVNAVTGPSMRPTLNPVGSPSKDYGLFNKYSMTEKKWSRGDIVTLRSPHDPDRVLIKRIIALEGDTVKTLPPYADKEVVIPEGHMWVEGDEPFFSNDDSNSFGPVDHAFMASKSYGDAAGREENKQGEQG